MARDWSQGEVEATVASYFAMLTKELHGESYTKAEYKRALVPLLNGRSSQAVEFKWCNISAVLLEHCLPYVDGYKPRSNYQQSLREVVRKWVAGDVRARAAMESAASVVAPVLPPLPPLVDVRTPPPALAPDTDRTRFPLYTAPVPSGRVGIDYAGREAANLRLGDMGEQFVVAYERERLRANGRADLAARVEHASQTRGDGLGYDVISFGEEGDERFLEVKTTNQGDRYPFFLTRNELDVSERLDRAWSLYRVYRFSRTPRLFVLDGALRRHGLDLEPLLYSARFP